MEKMFSYPGGKNRHAKWIIPLFPEQCEYDTYVEVFGGAFWVYQRLTPINKVVVYNDLNPLLANSWYCMSKKYGSLLSVCSSFPAENEVLYNQFKNELFTIQDRPIQVERGNVEAAAKYVYLETQRYIGAIPVSRKSKMVKMDGIKYRPKWEVYLDRLNRNQHMLENINDVVSLDFEQAINQYDNSSTLFYVDPPYYGTEHYYTEGDFTHNDHQRLSRILSQIKGKFALSYYSFSGIQSLYPQPLFNWHTQSVVKSMGTTKTNTTASVGEELLIRNY